MHYFVPALLGVVSAFILWRTFRQEVKQKAQEKQMVFHPEVTCDIAVPASWVTEKSYKTDSSSQR